MNLIINNWQWIFNKLLTEFLMMWTKFRKPTFTLIPTPTLISSLLFEWIKITVPHFHTNKILLCIYFTKISLTFDILQNYFQVFEYYLDFNEKKLFLKTNITISKLNKTRLKFCIKICVVCKFHGKLFLIYHTGLLLKKQTKHKLSIVGVDKLRKAYIIKMYWKSAPFFNHYEHSKFTWNCDGLFVFFVVWRI